LSVPDDPTFRASFPDTFDFLTSAAWTDGTPRIPGTVLLFSDAGFFKACLSDKDGGLVCFVAGGTLQEVLASAERAIGGEGGDWRAVKAYAPQKGKR
jgi:hypothetical protein